MRLTSKVPFLLIAYYDWILENSLTPHIRVRVRDGDGIPPNHPGIHEGSIIISIDPSAVVDFGLTNEAVIFRARFGGRDTQIRVAFNDLMLIFAKETSVGYAFEESEKPKEKTKIAGPLMVEVTTGRDAPEQVVDGQPVMPVDETLTRPRPTGKPTLRIVK